VRATATGEPGSFGDLLRRHRLAVGLTQEELAEQAGLSARGIADLERGARTRPYPATLQRLVQALGLPEAAVTALHAARRASVSASETSAPPPAFAASVPRSLVGPPGQSPVFIRRNAALDVLESQAGTSSDAAGKVAPWVEAPFATANGSIRLLERSDQVAALNEHPSVVVRSSHGRLVFIGGEAGVGKTALIRQLCAEHARSVHVLWGRATHYSPRVP
jgi:DNA-binding XRE family transcriptional regulator